MELWQRLEPGSALSEYFLNHGLVFWLTCWF
jgi:hypothetical protein